jgi:hypothetical protein
MTDTAEMLSDPIGGIRHQTIYEGLLKESLKLNLKRLLSWPNSSFYIDAYQISGRAYRGMRSAICWQSAVSRRSPRRGSTIFGCSRIFLMDRARSASARSASMTNFT